MTEANPDVDGGTPIRRIVVGVDGSEPSIRALQWAARQAEWSDATLEVLTAWTFPEHPAPLGLEIHVPWPDELIAQARVKLDEAIGDALPDIDSQRIHARVIRGSAGQVLLDAATDAELLVVGSRGRGRWRSSCWGR
ncbi:MAG TPA: universal stress protein [Acidimicrobiales bacterium]|nr:universal stress protein [Acidimicrobiales bacterium]